MKLHQLKSLRALWAISTAALLVAATPGTAIAAASLPSGINTPVKAASAGGHITITPGSGNGYWQVASDGGVFAYGDAQFAGSAVGITDSPIVAVAKTASGAGYWLVNDKGGVFAFGDAQFYGSAHNLKLAAPITGIARSQGGNGYFLVAADGGVFAFGDAQYDGSAALLNVTRERLKVGNKQLPNLVTSIQTAPGGGYWLSALDGGVFAYGAPFYGTAHTANPNFPIVGLKSTASGNGYWQYGYDGGVFSYGDATSHFYGSAVKDMQLPLAITMDRTQSGNGYWISDLLGHVYPKGDATSYGQASTLKLNAPIVSLTRSGS